MHKIPLSPLPTRLDSTSKSRVGLGWVGHSNTAITRPQIQRGTIYRAVTFWADNFLCPQKTNLVGKRDDRALLQR